MSFQFVSKPLEVEYFIHLKFTMINDVSFTLHTYSKLKCIENRLIYFMTCSFLVIKSHAH